MSAPELPVLTRRDRVVLVALGVVAGLASALFGIGGGLVVVPVLVALVRFPIKVAVGTSLLAIGAVALVGVATEALVAPENIRVAVALALVAGSLLGARLGAAWARALPDALLRYGLVAFIVVSALRLFGWISFGGGSGPLDEGLFSLEADPVPALALEAVVGFAAGVAASLFGIGGGIIVVPATTFLLADVPFHAARATSLLMILPTALVGSRQHARYGHVHAAAAATLAPAGALGAVAGVFLANRIEAPLLRTLFGTFLLLVAFRLVFVRKKSG